ncbi:MAG: hypothetical protein QM817_23885 [Archangium sp.]
MISSLSMVVVLAAAPVAGEYVADGGRGELKLQKGGTFRIQTVGGNAHVCDVTGAWKGELGTTSDEGTGVCHIKFVAKGKDVEVTPVDDEACRAWCGVRATFDGLFLTPVAGCRASEIKTSRDSFKKLYGAKKYVEAAAALSPLLEKCERVIDRFEVLWIRNDLALTQHHAGDDAACLKTLEPAGDLRTLNDEDAAGGEPAYEEVLKKLARATRTNSKLCGFVAPGAQK